jgi:CheY-like chemotaxis protein
LDTGIGIEDSLKPLIFNKFIMADSSTKRKTTGTGLGLAISRQYANFHGGHIDVKSEYGVGSCFKLTLPLKKDVLVNKGTTRLSAKKRPTILCVDDEPDVLKLLSSSLQGEGFNVLTAANGNKALEIIQQQKPDLICLDLIMPGISGFDLIHEIRKKFSDTELPIIVISAHEEHLHAIQSGANAYLSKPIQNSSLLKEIHSMLIKGIDSALIIDDDSSMQNLIACTLEEAGITSYTAANGNEALKTLQDHTPSVIFLDLLMPKLNGFEFLEAIRSNQTARKIPVIILTAKELNEAEVDQLNKSCNNILIKNKNSVLDVLHSLLDLSTEDK